MPFVYRRICICISQLRRYEELDPEQNNLAIVQNGQSFILEVDESDQVWVYVLSENLTDAEYTMTSEGEKVRRGQTQFL